ncbi:MAG TPA: hypothetical protein PK711_04575 [Bacteroidales bacterium]|nr:hypothetical protein [Bacteroidales bacterium]
MQQKDSHSLFHDLRKKYPTFLFESYSVIPSRNDLTLEFSFSISDTFFFKPRLIISLDHFHDRTIIDSPLFHQIVIHIGLIEMISYWKATCSPKVIIRPVHLDKWQVDWWKKLFYHGLGEFIYTNSIETDQESLVTLLPEGNSISSHSTFHSEEGYIVPIGGGKDSCVSLRLLSEYPCRPYMLNPRQSASQILRQSGFTESESVIFHRNIHPQLLELNRKGFLNGHTPFSALIAFTSLLASLLTGYRNIALSNESSANEATVPHTTINHQYSKTFEFENDFREYCFSYISRDINYFSLLRPLNELQIAHLFSGMREYFPYFRSCNEGSHSDSWCGRCAKCLFTYIILSPFLEENELIRIFGYNLLDNYLLKDLFDQLTGVSDEKPFECVGTVHEVNAAVRVLLERIPGDKLPLLLRHYQSLPFYSDRVDAFSWHKLLQNYDPAHFVPLELEKMIRKEVYE